MSAVRARMRADFAVRLVVALVLAAELWFGAQRFTAALAAAIARMGM